MERLGKKISILATGDELVNGDILDTNAPYIAHTLLEHHFIPGSRAVISDDQASMEGAIHYLLRNHAALITIGGLGPTSDDRTRFAISAALNKPLQFDSDSWDRICTKFTDYRLAISENNRQQCLFPNDAEIYPNANGTASACCISEGEKLIFMLPGPPNECRPILAEYVIPRLQQTELQQQIFSCSWMLLGVSEGAIAKQLDPLVEDFPECNIGYRVIYPYLEVKLQSSQQVLIEQLGAKIEPMIKTRLVSRDKKTASEQLLQQLKNAAITLTILDTATKGYLASVLAKPENHQQLFFYPMSKDFMDRTTLNDKKNLKNTDIELTLTGLDAYWQQQSSSHTDLNITIKTSHPSNIPNQQKTITVPIRGPKTLSYAAELLCEYLLGQLPGLHAIQ